MQLYKREYSQVANEDHLVPHIEARSAVESHCPSMPLWLADELVARVLDAGPVVE